MERKIVEKESETVTKCHKYVMLVTVIQAISFYEICASSRVNLVNQLKKLKLYPKK